MRDECFHSGTHGTPAIGMATIQHSDGARREVALCHGLSCLAAAGGRLLQPGDAQAEPVAAGGVRGAIAFLRQRPPPLPEAIVPSRPPA